MNTKKSEGQSRQQGPPAQYHRRNSSLHLPLAQVPHTLFQAQALCPSPNTKLPILYGWVLTLL